MDAEPKRLFLYIDDGHPESRDYDDNYVAIGPHEPRGLPQALRRLWSRWRGGATMAACVTIHSQDCAASMAMPR